MGASLKGGWVLLQNCMLAKSWMPTLERLCFEMVENREAIQPDHRLFLTSMPVPYFPVSVLQGGVKMTNEPPKGIRNQILRCYANLVKPEEYETCKKPGVFKKLLAALAFFHSNIVERRKFGPLGWNILYAFDESDLETSINMMRRMLDEQDEVPYDALNFVTGQINYGGRVTDDNDRTCIIKILARHFTPKVLEETYAFSASGIYKAPPEGSYDDAMAYFKSLPLVDDPEIFGMHENANVIFNTNESLHLMGQILNLQPRATGGGGGAVKSSDDIVLELQAEFVGNVPSNLDIETAGPTTFVYQPNGLLTSLATVLKQEIVKFNKLLDAMSSSLAMIKRAINGFIVMSTDLDNMFSAFLLNKLPPIWVKTSFASLKSLASWFKDVLYRVEFMKTWIANGQPPVFPLPVFFFPQGFMTGALQTFARKYSVAIDTLNFEFTVMHETVEEITESPDDGVLCGGLWLEGARFDVDDWVVRESRPAEMFTPLPVVHFVPAVGHTCAPTDYGCPIYKTAERKGVLSTTGMSTNFVVLVELPTDCDPAVWTLYGMAALCNLTD